jgi:hypothetical protein
VATTTIPTWVNEANALIAPTLIPCGGYGAIQVPPSALVRSTTLDLRGKAGAFLVICLGRLTVVGLTGNIFVSVRRMELNSTQTVPADYIAYTGGNTNVATTVAVQNTTVASGVNIIPMTADPTGLGSAGNVNILFSGLTVTQASTLTATAALTAEWARMAAAFNATASLGGTAIIVDSPTRLARIASEQVYNNAEIIGPVFLEGGALYEVIINCLKVSVGGPIAVAAYWEELTCDTTT